jgi:glycosidase
MNYLLCSLLAVFSFGPLGAQVLPNLHPMSSNQPNTHKFVVYQMMFHLWGNQYAGALKKNGSYLENGVTKFSDVSTKSLTALQAKGISHLYATGLLEHATMEDFSAYGSPLDHPMVVKGRAGSPFAIKDYYDVNPFLATEPQHRMKEFGDMLERIHQREMKLIIDFVPNHLARQYYSDQKPDGVQDFGAKDKTDLSFSPQNNFYYLPGTQFEVPDGVHPPVESHIPYIEIPAKVSGNNVFSAKPSIHDWFETVKLNYGLDVQHGNVLHADPIPDTWLKMVDVLTYWTNKGVDGFRCDMAEMVPVEFWAFAIPKIKAINPSVVFIAEIYQPDRYRDYIFKGKFDYLYDKVGLYDGIRRLMEQKPEANTADITRVWQQESGDFSEHMLRFLENHDETRINSPGFAANNLWSSIPGMVVTASLHHGPVMLYFGQEFGEKANEVEGFNEADDRTSMFDFWRVDTHQRWVNGGKFNSAKLSVEEKALDHFYIDLFNWIKESEAISKGHFFDLQYAQAPNYPAKKVYSYLRFTDKEAFVILTNFDAKDAHDFDLVVPELAWNMMKRSPGKMTISKLFFPPNQNQKPSIQGNQVHLPANSVLVIKL